jgi:glycerol-3-phosphate O-acyltransferase
LDPTAPKRSIFFVSKTITGFILRNLWLMALSKWQRFGYACVNFGPQVSAKEYCRDRGLDFSKLERDDRFTEIEKLCNRLIASIQEIVPVLPVSLVATVFLEAQDRAMTDFEVKAHSHRLIEELQSLGAPVYVSKRSAEHMISTALNMLKLRKMIVESDGFLKVDTNSLGILNYYANAIAHWRRRMFQKDSMTEREL